MKISYVGGGLGNQVLQYIFARWLEICGEEPVYIDHSHTQANQYHNGFDLPLAFPHVKLRLLQKELTEKQWSDILQQQKLNFVNFPYFLTEERASLTFVHEYPFRFSNESSCTITDIKLQGGLYHPHLKELQEELLYFNGVWKSKFWFFEEKVHPIVKEELQFAPFTEPHNITYAQQIKDSSASVSVHIRRGDMLEMGLFTGHRYYQQATKRIRQHLDKTGEKPVFFVFSDDLSWCKENRDALGFLPEETLVFIDGNQPGTGTQFRDLQLMSLCRHMIITNSTFSLVALYLNAHQSYIASFSLEEPTKDWVCALN